MTLLLLFVSFRLVWSLLAYLRADQKFQTPSLRDFVLYQSKEKQNDEFPNESEKSTSIMCGLVPEPSSSPSSLLLLTPSSLHLTLPFCALNIILLKQIAQHRPHFLLSKYYMYVVLLVLHNCIVPVSSGSIWCMVCVLHSDVSHTLTER